MASFQPAQSLSGSTEGEAARAHEGAADPFVAPVIAGAYARGIADTLEALGLPGLFLDRAGAIIFASREAQALLGGRLRLCMGHLVADGTEDSRALDTFLDTVMADGFETGAVHLRQSGRTLHQVPRTAALARPGQIVHAVFLLTDPDDTRHAALLQGLAWPTGAMRA